MDPAHPHTRSSRIPRPSLQQRSPSPPKGERYSALSPTPEHLSNASNTSVQQLKDEITQLKRKLEEENSLIKTLKHEKVKEIKKVRTEEQGKSKNALEDQRYKLNQEKERALENLRSQLAKQHASEMSKILKERESLSKASRGADKERMSFTQSLQQEMRTESREEAKKLFAAEKNRFIQEIEELNRKKRELEEQLKNESLAGRRKLEDYRRLNEEHQREIDQLRKDARKDIILLLDELKAKDRIILELEKELGHQAGYASGLAGENGSSKNLLNLTKMRDTWEKMTSTKPTTSRKERAVRNLGTESLSQSSSSLDESKISTNTSDENQRIEISDKVSKVSSRDSPSSSTVLSAKDSLIPRGGTSSRGSPMPLRGSPLPTESTKFRRSLPVLSPPARSSTPTRQVTDSLQSKLREAEDAKRKAERKCKMLSDELKSMKKDIPRSRRPQSPWTTEKIDLLTKQKVSKKPAHVRRRVDNEETREREEEISRLRRQMDDQFEEIVALKQAAMAERNRQLFGRRNSLPLETQSEFDVSLNSSLAISEADDLRSLGRSLSRPDLDSRESLTASLWNDYKLEAAEETIQGLKEKVTVLFILKEMEASKEMLLSELHDSKEQNELLEFQLLEADESGKRMSGKEMPFTDEVLREILRYMQTHEGKEIDLSELKQQIDQLSQEKVGKLSDADQKSLESLREILELVEVEVGRLREEEFDLREEVKEKSEEVYTLASELTQLLTQLTEKEETIQVTNKKVDELLENEFDLSEKIKDYETQVALLQEELLEARYKHAREFEPKDSNTSEPVVEKADSEEGEKTPGKSHADKEVQVRFRRLPRQDRGMSREYDFGDVDGQEEDVTFSDDDLIGDLLPDEDDEVRGAGMSDGDTGRVDKMEVKLEKGEVQEQRSSHVPGEGLGGVESGERHPEQLNRMQGRIKSLEEENNGLLTKQADLQREICNLKETVSHLENKVFESEGNAETMSKVIADQIIQMQNLRKDSENLMSKDAVEMREKELQGVIKDLQDKEKEMRLEMEKMNEERKRQMEMLESERRMIEDRLVEAEGEKKLLRDALEKEKLSKDVEVRGEEGVRFYKDEAERLKFVIEELNEKQAQAEELVASLELELQNARQQLEREEAEKKQLEGRCCQLKEQREEAEDNLKMKKEELQYLLREKGEMEIVRDELQREIADLKEKMLQKVDIAKVVEKCEDETEMGKDEIGTLKERVAYLEHENKDLVDYRDEVENLKQQIKVLYAEKVAVEESLQVVASVREKLAQDLEGMEKANGKVVKESEHKVMELMQAVDDMERRLVEKDMELDEIRKMKDRETRELSETVDTLQKETEMLQKTNERLSGEKEQAESLKEEKEKLLCEKLSLEERVNQLQSSETDLEQEVKEEREKSLKIEMENDKMFEEIKHLKSLLEEQTAEKDGNIFEELQENILQLEIEKGSLESDLLKEKSENEKLRKDKENMEFAVEQMRDREIELKAIISELEAVGEKEDGYERKIKDQESEINALQRKVEDTSNEVQVLENKIKKLEESESKLFSDSFEKDAKIQAMCAKEMGLEEKVRKLLMEAAGAEKQHEEGGGLMDELEARKIKIGDLEDELEKIRVEGELLFDNNGNTSDSEYSRGLRDDFGREENVSERGEGHGENLSEDGGNVYSVVEQEIWEEVQVSVVRPTAMAPPVVGGQGGDDELGIFGHENNSVGLEEQEEESTLLNRRIEMLEAEVKSQKGLLQEETLAKEKLQKEIWEMLQTQSDLRQQLTTLQDQNDGLQANMKFLRELEEETESLTARVEKMTEEKRVLEAKMREVEASKAENEEKLEEKGRELDTIKEQVDAIEEERKMLMEKLKEMENAMKARLGGLEASERYEYPESEKQDSSRELEESLRGEIRKLEERNSLLEEQLHDKTKISLDTSEMDSLLFSSDDEGEFDARVEEAVEEKVKRLEKLNHALKEQVKHLLAFQGLGVEDSELVREDVEDEARLKERDETEEDKENSLDEKTLEEDIVENVANEEDLKKQLALSEENNKYLEQQLEDLRQLMQDGGFENQDVLIEKVEVLEKSQKQLVSEIESLKKDLADKEDELLNTQAEMLSTERKFSMRVEELEKSEQSLLEKLEATNEEWRQQSESSMERISELENVRGQLREQLSKVEEQLEELQVSGGFDNLSSTQQSGPSLLDEGLGALDIGRSSFDYTDDFDEEEGDAMQHEMEVALRELDEEEDEDKVAVLNEENEKLMERVEELEKSEVELMEKVGILEQSELAMSDLCDNLKADIDRKMLEVTELREKLSRMENVEDQSNYDAKEKQGILEGEVKHLQEQLSFMEEERKSLLTKIEEMEVEKDVKEMEEKEEQETAKMEILLEEKGAQVMLEENKVEISIKQWQEQSLEEIQQVEKPVRVRTVAPYNAPLPYWNLGVPNVKERNQVRVEVVNWTWSGGEEDQHMQEFADEEEFLKNVVSCVEQRKPNTTEMNFEEKLLEEEQESVDAVEEDKSVEMLDDFGERELSVMKEQSNQMKTVLIYKNFEEVVLKPSDRESKVGEEEEQTDEEPNFDYCEEPMIFKEEVLTEQITDDVFMPLRCENQDNSTDSAKLAGQDGGEEIQSLKEKIRYLEENEVILKERISVLEGDERLLVDSSEIAEEDGSRTGEESKEELMMKIRDLEDNEVILKAKIEEMEIMQSALQETLSQADAIVREREAEYLEKIEALESSQSDLKHLIERPSSGDQVSGDAFDEDVAGEETDRKVEEEAVRVKIEKLENLVEEKESQILILEASLEEKIEIEETFNEQKVALQNKIEMLEHCEEEKDQLIKEMEKQLEEEGAKADREGTLKERIADLEETVAKKSEQIVQLECELADVGSQQGRGDPLQEADVEASNVSGEAAVADAKVDQVDSVESGILEKRIEELENSEMKLITELEESLENEENLKEEVQKLEKLKNDAGNERDEFRERAKHLESDVNELKSKLDILEDEKDKYLEEIAEKAKALEDMQETKLMLEEDRDEKRAEIEELVRLREEKDEELIMMTEDLETKSKRLEELDGFVKTLEMGVENLTSKLVEEEEKVRCAEAEMEKMKREKEQVEDEVRQLKEMLESQGKRILSGRGDSSHHQAGDVERGVEKEDDAKQTRNQEDELEAVEDEISTQGNAEETLSVLQEELHLANIQIEDLKRSKIALEEQLKKLRSNRRSSNMITLPEDEYKSLKARAQMVGTPDDSEETVDLNSTNDEEQFANAGKLWVKLDQTTKELRKYQELYNTTIKEVGHLKLALREVSEKHEAYLQGRRGSMLIDTVALPSSESDKTVDHKLIQTRPLKTIASDALKVRLATDTSRSQPITLQELLEAIPEPTELGDILMPKGSPYKPEIIAADDSLFLLDTPSPLKTTPTQGALSESFLNTSMWPPDLAKHEKQRAWEEIQSALASENMSEEGDTPPLPKSMPPRTSSNSSFVETPDLPDLTPPNEFSFLSDDDFQKDEVDLDQSEVKKINAQTQEGQQGVQSDPPPVPPKPAAPDWLKEMQLKEWEKVLKEAEEMRNKLQEFEEKVVVSLSFLEYLLMLDEEKEEQLNQLKAGREELELKAREAEDGYHYKVKLQEKEKELEEKEKQILRLKGDLKKKEAEATPLKLQLESLKEKQLKLKQENGQIWQLKDKLERLQDQYKDKEQSMRLLEAEKMRMREDIEGKDRKLFSKEREVEKCQEEIEILKEKLRDYEKGRNQKSDEEVESEKEYLKKQNEQLRKQVDQLEPLKERMDNLQSQLEKGLSSKESSSSLMRKLQQAEKMLEEKTADEMRLLEDNECLQKRIDNLEKEKNYRDGLEADYESMKELFNELEHKKHEAELSVAPLKAKVSYLLKKFQEKDAVLRQMASEVAVKNPERASEIFEEIEKLQHQLPLEDIHPRKTAWEEKPFKFDRRKARSLDVLNNNGSEVIEDNLERNGGVSLQDLIKEASKPAVGNFSITSDIGRSQDSLLAAFPELKSNHMRGSPHFKERNAGRRKKSKVKNSSSESDDTLNGLLQSDAEDNIDFAIPDTSSSHLPNLVSSGGIMAPGTSSPSVNSSHRTRPPLLRTMKTDLGTGGKPSPVSSMERTQPVNGVDALMSGVPHRGIGSDEAGGVMLPPGHLNGVPQSGTGVVPLVSSGPTIPSSGVAGLTGSFAKNTMPMFNQPHSKGVGTSQQNGPPLNRGPVGNTINYNSGNVPPVNGPTWNGAPRVPTSHELSTSLSSSLPSSHLQPSSGNHHMAPGTGYAPPTTGVLQPPRSVSVARMVSKHSVLLVWTLPVLDEMARNNGHEVAGYKIYVNGNLKQFVTSPHLAKALVTNLNLKMVRTFGIQTVSVHGKGSSVRQVNFTLPHSDVSQSGMSDASLSDSAREPSTDASSVVGERPKQRMFMAVYSYNPMEHSPNENPERELTFKEGDLIRVQGHMRNDGFYHGMINGKKGLVPSNFIEEISISSSGKKKTRQEAPRKQPQKEVSKTRKEKDSDHRAYSKSSQSKV
ncbi:Janus kinase and microtubule-interacting protein 2 [Holothuria leucospilota]|uniref:Janus kinase and microtubule-interacting protein 2 n=1 Tax=Holothuria leucospilota TaxID=206669 RepID=A0A9Q1BHY3_HOLLE|nr:Janus kinase and microtubule-interacting protein 2 [Holothuria leucospilota]